MGRKLDRFTGVVAAGLVLGALLACKKKEEPPPPVVTTPPPTPEPPKSAEPAKTEKKDEVKRYGDKETEESGTVRVKYQNAKVYNEADMTTDHIATLNAGTLVNRKARFSNWLLIDYPSGVGELSPGWVLNAHIDDRIVKIDPDAVKRQDAGAVAAAPSASAAPVASAAPSAKPTPSAVASTPTPPPKPVSSAGKFRIPAKPIPSK
jgi:hypothetical protein